MEIKIGFWVVGEGIWAKPQFPNPQSPIPNPQSPSITFLLILQINLN